MNLPPRETRHEYTQRDTILYALGIGAGEEAFRNPGLLQFVYEEQLVAIPTMAVVLAYPGFWLKEPQYNINWKHILHGEQSVTIHQPLAPAGKVVSDLFIDEIYDKGEEKGALLYSRREIYDEKRSIHLATVSQASFLRAEGGFGGKRDGAPKPHVIPAGAPDSIKRYRTREEQAILYRLSGDTNPLHIDHNVADAAGFEGPILHGLATYGFAGRALLDFFCRNEPSRFRKMKARFSKPVYPGDELTVQLWRETSGQGSFRVLVPARNSTVLDNGYFEYIEKERA